MYGASNRRRACWMASKTQNQTVPTLFPIHAVGRFLNSQNAQQEQSKKRS